MTERTRRGDLLLRHLARALSALGRARAVRSSLAIFGERVAPYDPNASSLDVLAPPSSDHLLGTTESGSDVLSQLLVGARVSIVVGFAAAIISAVLGSAVGLRGGYFGGWTDRILDALENWFLVIPTLPLMIVLAAAARPVARGPDPRHRADLVGGHRADRPRPGAHAARARVRRARPRAGRRATATSSAPTSFPTRCR